jgi:flagellar assembly protein FliH
MLKEQAVISNSEQANLKINDWVLESFGGAVKKNMYYKKDLPEKERFLKEMEEEKKLAKENAFEIGKKEGYAIGHAQALADVEQECGPLRSELKNIVATLSPAGMELDQKISEAMCHLAYQIANMVIKVEGKVNPEVLNESLREVFAQLPSMLGAYTLVANSQDVLVIEAYLAKNYPQAQINIQTQDSLTPGGIRLQGPTVFIEGSLEQRLLNLIQKG